MRFRICNDEGYAHSVPLQTINAIETVLLRKNYEAYLYGSSMVCIDEITLPCNDRRLVNVMQVNEFYEFINNEFEALYGVKNIIKF